MGQGNVFTPVCLSFCSQGGCGERGVVHECIQGRHPRPRGRHLPSWNALLFTTDCFFFRMRVRCLAACPKCSVPIDTIVSNYQKQNGASDITRRESSRETLSQKGSGSGDAEPETPPTPSKFTSTGFYGKRPSLPPGTTTSQPPPPPLTTEGSTSHRKLPPDVASPRAVKKATSTYSRENLRGSVKKKSGNGAGDLLGSGKKKSGNGGNDSFTFDLPSPTTPSTSLGEIYRLICGSFPSTCPSG